MTHYQECPRHDAKSRAACVCPLIDRVLTNAVNRVKEISLTPYPDLARGSEIGPLAQDIRQAIHPKVA